MNERRRLGLGVLVKGALIAVLALLGCDTFYFLRGALHGDCDAPASLVSDAGVNGARTSNCQPMGSVCCRVSSQATRTSCEYPADCYDAPYKGQCSTAVDCADTQTCTSGTCQCSAGGPPCVDPQRGVIVCCSAGQICAMGTCTSPMTDGGV